MHFRLTALRAAFFLLIALACSVLAVPARAAVISGEQKTVVLLVNFQDQASQPITRDAAHALVFGSVSDYYWEVSYQKAFLSGNTYGWLTIPVSRSVCDVNLIAQEADKAATAAGIDLSAYTRIVYLATQNACTAAGYNNGPGVWPSRTWIITDRFDMQLIAHEMGHNFGLSHSQALDCGAAVLGGTCTNYSYGDAADAMGSGITPHFNAFQKEKLGWLNASGQPPITTVSASGTYTISPLETTGTAAKALKIARGIDPQSGQMGYYYVEYRQPQGFDAVLGSIGNLSRGVLVHTGSSGQYSVLLDMTPNSDPASAFYDIRDGALEAGQSYTDSAAGISIGLVSADANGATISVTLGSNPAPACTRAAPGVSLAGGGSAVAAGTTVGYTLTVTNRDSSACTASTFTLARSLPTGWAGSLATGTLSLSPGTSGSTALSVTSPPTAGAGSYSIGAATSSSLDSVHTASAAAAYSIASPADGGLANASATDKSSYLRGETVRMSALVKSGGVAVSGASVRFTIISPSGNATAVSAVTGSDGYARSSYKLGKGKAAIGRYTLRADATYANATATSSATFSVR